MRKIGIFLVLSIFIISLSYGDLNTLMNKKFNFKELHKYKRALAYEIANLLKEKNNREFIINQLLSRNSKLDLVNLISNINRGSLYQTIKKLDYEIRKAKGIENKINSILEIRLAFPEKRNFDREKILVAYVPNGNEKSWRYIEAFDIYGKRYELDVHKAPSQQVIVVGLDAKKDMRAGLELLNEELKKAGMQPQIKDRENLEVMKLNYIRLKDDKEPWISGDAEIYALVNGISPESEKASIIAIEMPYLDNDNTDYRPNQVLIVWKNYRYKAANINLYEHDDNTNYKEIAAKLIKAIGHVVPEYNYIFEIASQIIKLMPDSWFSNDDDYVDVFYTLENKPYVYYYGASNNAKIILEPYTISSK